MTRYPFTWDGIDNFVDSAFNEAVDHGSDIVISVGNNKIHIPLIPESFESMELMLNGTLTIWEADYK